MELNKYVIEEIMKLESDGSTSLMVSLSLLKKYKIFLDVDRKTYDTIYKVKLDDILKDPISAEDMIKLRNGGWELDNVENVLKLNLNKKY